MRLLKLIPDHTEIDFVGARYFAFAIDDYDDVVQRLNAASVDFRSVDIPGTPIRQIFIRDLNGVNIELNYRPR